MSSCIRIRRVRLDSVSKPVKRLCHVLPRRPLIDMGLLGIVWVKSHDDQMAEADRHGLRD
jgi:hypothetical protein